MRVIMSKDKSNKITKTKQEQQVDILDKTRTITLATITLFSILSGAFTSNERLSLTFTILSIILASVSLLLIIPIFKLKKEINNSISLFEEKNSDLEQQVTALRSDLKDYELLKHFTYHSSQLISKSFSDDSIYNCVSDIKFAIQSLYSVCKNHLTRISDITNEFNVRFMTKDYLNKTITIPVFDDSSSTHCPTSMAAFLNGGNPYSKTITAKIYQSYEKNASEPEMYICENTETDEQFQETSDNQKQRIKSMIVYPIKYNTQLVGTLVLQCNVPNFFKKDKKDLWKLVLDVYAICLGEEKNALDSFVTNSMDEESLIKCSNDSSHPLYYFVQPQKNKKR